MTDDNSNLVDTDDLDAFSDVFFGKEKAVEEKVEEEVKDTEDDALANDTDTDASEEDDEVSPEESEEEGDDEDESEDADDEDSADEDEEEPEPEPEDKGKRKKSDYQTRINELTKARREAERREAALLARLETLEAQARQPKDSKQESLQEQLPPGAPTPDDKDEKGEPKYPLGEYDKNYLHDFMKFQIAQELKVEQERQAAEAAQKAKAQEAEAIRTQWEEKLEAAEEEIPEIREHIADLVDTFANIDPSYGEYLATTIMTSENGPAIMEYLSQNIGEAQKIVASGPAAATRAIGRIEARLELSAARPKTENKSNKKPSDAPPPPKVAVRGSRSSTSVRGDTDNLDAFEKVFFNK